jgi:uncharacterized protein YbbC (DUF1343 family)
MSSDMTPLTGLDRLIQDPGLLSARRPGLLTNFAAVTQDLSRGVDAMRAVGIPIKCLIGPEHGYWGTAEAGEGGAEETDIRTGIPIVSSYRVSGSDLDDLLRRLDIDAVVVDMQDIGVRFYTYLWSLYDIMQACAHVGLPVVVLDRPSPLPGTALGPGLEPTCSSFVGRVNIPLRHGRRIGTLAHEFANRYVRNNLDISVIEAPGPDGAMPWVAASPNMPRRSTVALYPGTCLVEGTSWSEGRGSTLPFEMLGAPWAGPEFAEAIRELELPGIRVREAVFGATHGDFGGRTVIGAQIHLAGDPEALAADPEWFNPVRIGVEILRVMRHQHPRSGAGDFWRRNSPMSTPFIDLLWGSSALREGLDDNADYDEITLASPRGILE